MVTVETALTAVLGLATATEAAAVPAELATAVVLLPRAIIGAAQPLMLSRILKPRTRNKKADPSEACDLPEMTTDRRNLLALANNVEYPSSPGFVYNRFEFTIWSFVI